MIKESRKHCTVCNAVIFNDSDFCSVCAAAPSGSHCDVTTCEFCRKGMLPAGARRCNACGTFKNWPRLPYVKEFASIIGGPLSLLTSVVLVGLFFGNYWSHTEFKVARANETLIYLKVWNTGHKPSALVGYRLKFDRIPDKEAVLALTNDDAQKSNNVIASGTPVDIAIAMPGLTTLEKHDVQHLAGWDSMQPMTLTIDVQESSDGAREHHTREDHFLAGRIAAFVKYNWGN